MFALNVLTIKGNKQHKTALNILDSSCFKGVQYTSKPKYQGNNDTINTIKQE